MSAQPVIAQSARNIQATLTTPLAVRGGVMMLPLTAQPNGSDWPATIRIRFDGGAQTDGMVIWMEAGSRQRDLMWDQTPGAPLVRPIEPTDDPRTGRGAPYLLFELPMDGAQTIRLPNQTLRPRWVDPHPPRYRPEEEPRWNDSPAAHALLDSAAERPIPPLDYWRWVLLADRLGVEPPPFTGQPAAELVARHLASTWRYAIGRLGSHSRGVADHCHELLTRIVLDGDTPVAAWLADTSEIEPLFALLTNPDIGAERLVQRSLEWADTRDPLVIWIEQESGEQVTLAAMNPGMEARVASVLWVHRDAARQRQELPTGFELPPGRITRFIVERPALPPPPPDFDRLTGFSVPATPQDDAVLRVRSGRYERQFRLRPRMIAVQPPGYVLGPMLPTLTLAEARSGTMLMPSARHATQAIFRRADGRWEIFFECMRPGGPPDQQHEGRTRSTLAFAQRFDRVRSIEAVTLIIGPVDAPTIIFTVPEIGDHRLFAGQTDGPLQIHRRSYGDRWYCRIVLPDRWLGEGGGIDPVLIGVARSFRDSSGLVTAPRPALPWRPDPSRVLLDLRQWSDLPMVDPFTRPPGR